MANGITTGKADLIFASLPYRILHEFQIPLYEQMKERDADFYRALEERGFMLDWGADGSGLFMKYLRRGSGYYIDVGACDLVIDGSIKLVSGRQIERLSETGVVLDDGSELPADLVVYATGYGSMNGWAADLISQEAADRVGKVWGLGSDTPKDPGPWEGEQRNMWKPTQVGGAVVPRRQPAPEPALLAVPVAAAQGPDGGPADPGLRPAGDPPPALTDPSPGRPSGPERLQPPNPLTAGEGIRRSREQCRRRRHGSSSWPAFAGRAVLLRMPCRGGRPRSWPAARIQGETLSGFGDILGQIMQQGLGGQGRPNDAAAEHRPKPRQPAAAGSTRSSASSRARSAAPASTPPACSRPPAASPTRRATSCGKDQVGGLSGAQIGGIGAIAGALLGGGLGGAARGGAMAVLGTLRAQRAEAPRRRRAGPRPRRPPVDAGRGRGGDRRRTASS